MTIINSSIRIALFEPRIPPNTGNIARTCAAFNLELNLIEPLGFSLNDKYLKRAGLDYWPYVEINVFRNFNEFYETISTNNRLIGISSYGGESVGTFKFHSGDILLFGREDSGLPDTIRNQCNSIATIPMPAKARQDGSGGVRSLNLSVACGILIYEVNRQILYP